MLMMPWFPNRWVGRFEGRRSGEHNLPDSEMGTRRPRRPLWKPSPNWRRRRAWFRSPHHGRGFGGRTAHRASVMAKLEQAIDASPGNMAFTANLAYAYAVSGKREEAVDTERSEDQSHG